MEPILQKMRVSIVCAPELLLRKRRFSQGFSEEVKVLIFLKAGVDTGCLKSRGKKKKEKVTYYTK